MLQHMTRDKSSHATAIFAELIFNTIICRDVNFHILSASHNETADYWILRGVVVLVLLLGDYVVFARLRSAACCCCCWQNGFYPHPDLVYLFICLFIYLLISKIKHITYDNTNKEELRPPGHLPTFTVARKN